MNYYFLKIVYLVLAFILKWLLGFNLPAWAFISYIALLVIGRVIVKWDEYKAESCSMISEIPI
jgi:hypothetical protein